MKPTRATVPAAVLALLLALACGPAQDDALGTGGGEWRSFAGDPGSNRYSPADQIDATNFGSLEVAWRWQSPDVAWKRKLVRAIAEGRNPYPVGKYVNLTDFQGTPLMIDGVLYGVTSIGQLYAIDAASGETLWTHDPQAYLSARKDSHDFWFPKHRGVTWWADGDDQRVILPTHDGYLVAVDAKTGTPVASFGDGGRVDLLAGLRRPEVQRLTEYFQTSPAAIYRDTLIVGNSIGDRPAGPRSLPGDVRGYDVRSGELRWTFHTVPAEGEYGVDSWENEAWRDAGAANAWGPISVDPKRGTVYVTTSTPTNDFYGGHRLGDNLFAESLICLNAETGERLWHYQLIRHGLWDYDPGAPANVVDLKVDGRKVEAVAQVTKQGFTFVLDRATGEPVWPIEERAVPASDVPGERAAEFQPFPTKPPPFERQGFGEDDLIDFSPELRTQALQVFEKFRSGPLFTPPSLQGTIVSPGPAGGSNWRGAGFDPEDHSLYVPSITHPLAVRVRPGAGGEAGFRYQAGGTLPLEMGRQGRERGIPIVKPPYSRITAIDLDRGEIRWQVANGNGPRNHPLLAPHRLPPLGSGAHTCVLVTPTLVMAADGATYFGKDDGEPIFRAYDKASGEVVGELRLPARVRACPMTYLHEGRQYLVLPVADTRYGPALLALALP